MHRWRLQSLPLFSAQVDRSRARRLSFGQQRRINHELCLFWPPSRQTTEGGDAALGLFLGRGLLSRQHLLAGWGRLWVVSVCLAVMRVYLWVLSVSLLGVFVRNLCLSVCGFCMPVYPLCLFVRGASLLCVCLRLVSVCEFYVSVSLLCIMN